MGRSSAPTSSAVALPMVASSERVKSKPSGGWSVATSTAEAPACDASSVPPPTSVAASMASPVTTPTCQVPVPIALTSRSAMKMPTDTPIASSTARLRRCADGQAERDDGGDGREEGRPWPTISVAISHASEAATEA